MRVCIYLCLLCVSENKKKKKFNLSLLYFLHILNIFYLFPTYFLYFIPFHLHINFFLWSKFGKKIYVHILCMEKWKEREIWFSQKAEVMCVCVKHSVW